MPRAYYLVAGLALIGVLALAVAREIPGFAPPRQENDGQRNKAEKLKRQLQGKWRVVEGWLVWPSGLVEHERLTEEEHIFEVRGERVILHQLELQKPWRELLKELKDWINGNYLVMKLAADQEPAWLDLAWKRDDGRAIALGIVKLQGDELLYLRSIDLARRPRDFDIKGAPPGSVMIRAIREKKAGEDTVVCLVLLARVMIRAIRAKKAEDK